MAEELYTVEQVADLLGLHVKTVRGYVRDGRLAATRIGRQYRIARSDLEAFTGRPAAVPARDEAVRTRSVEVSGVVQVDAIGREEVGWLGTTILGYTGGGRDVDGEPLRVETVYDEERARLRIIVIGGPGRCADLLKLVDQLLRERRYG